MMWLNATSHKWECLFLNEPHHSDIVQKE